MQDKKTRRSNKARTEATRTALLQAARQLFVEKGYADTGTPEIVASAKVTRGALYHHFSDKTDLFRGVLREEARLIAEQIEESSKNATSAEEALLAGMDAYFDAMSVPGRARLMFIDGPSVLGPEEIDEINQAGGGDELLIGLQQIYPPDTDLPLRELSELLAAAFDKAALAISLGKSPDQYKKAMTILLKNTDNM